MRIARTYLPCVRVDRRRAAVLLVAHGLAPGDDLALVVGLLHRDVDHEPGRRGAVPVVLARFEEDLVAGTDHLDLIALALATADVVRHPDRLAAGMRVPPSAGPRREIDVGRGEPRIARGHCDHVDVDGAGELVVRAGAGVGGVPGDLHARSSFYGAETAASRTLRGDDVVCRAKDVVWVVPPLDLRETRVVRAERGRDRIVGVVVVQVVDVAPRAEMRLQASVRLAGPGDVDLGLLRVRPDRRDEEVEARVPVRYRGRVDGNARDGAVEVLERDPGLVAR